MINDDRINRRAFLRAGAGCAAALAFGESLAAQATTSSSAPLTVLSYDRFAHHVDRFNTMERERLANLIPNADAWDWMVRNVPAFECPDANVEEIYWYRWWTFRKSLVRTPSGRIAPMEFFGRAPVSSAVGHHVMEGRWLRDQSVVDDLLLYWLRSAPDGSPPKDTGKYSGWTIFAAWHRWLVNGDSAFVTGLLDDFVHYYRMWERLRMNGDGSFWQFDVRDAMEESISGSRTDRNLRPPLNSYMYGNAIALARIAKVAGNAELEATYTKKAEGLRKIVEQRLWDQDARFFKVRFVHPGRATNDTLCDAREAIGFIPWYFDLPSVDAGFEEAWAQLADPHGFKAPFGITTAEQRHPRYRFHYSGGCEWNGPVWPFATSQTLTGLSNVLNDRQQTHVTVRDYFDALLTYARSTYRDGKPYIGEYLDGKTGEWLHKDLERGRYYNHSTFCDLVINGLIGIRPQADQTVVVNPLVPADAWDWFCLDGVAYHGRSLTVIWDRTGQRYQRGAGLTLLADGTRIAHSEKLERLRGELSG